jgi:SAM-dependent methyltransferase
MEKLKTLPEIFKGLTKLCDKWEPYFPIYEKWFSQFRGQSPKILEIGVYKGGSAEMWLEYFGEGTKIIGIDVDPSCLGQSSPPSFTVINGDAGSTDFWFSDMWTSGQFNEYFDIIIDDGGHHMIQQIVALEHGWNKLKMGGIYLCEDTHTSYWDHWPRGGLKNPQSYVEYTKGMIDVLTEEHQYKGPDGEVFKPRVPVDDNLLLHYKNQMVGMHFYNSVVVIEKGTPLEFNRVYSIEPPPRMIISEEQRPQRQEIFGQPSEFFSIKT